MPGSGNPIDESLGAPEAPVPKPPRDRLADRDSRAGGAPTLKQVLDAALALGAEAGRLGESMREVADVEARLAALADRLELDRRFGTVAGSPFPAVAIVTSIEGNALLLGGRWVPGLAAAAGIHTVGVAEGDADVRVDAAGLGALAPATIIFALRDASLTRATDRVRALVDSADWRAARGLPGRFYLIDGTRFVNITGATIARSAELLAHAVHDQRAGVTPAHDEAIAWNVEPTK